MVVHVEAHRRVAEEGIPDGLGVPQEDALFEDIGAVKDVLEGVGRRRGGLFVTPTRRQRPERAGRQSKTTQPAHA